MTLRTTVLCLSFCIPLSCQTTSYRAADFAGAGDPGFAGDGAAASTALLNRPCAIAADASGTLYVADSLNHRVRRIRNNMIATVAGNGTQGFSGDGGQATAAQLNTPCGLAVDASGNLYISDSANHRVRRVASDGVISTLAGDGTMSASQLSYPMGLAVDTSGNLYVADSANNRVLRRTGAGTITTVASSLSLPSSVALASNGDLYILDTGNGLVRRFRSGTLTTIAGNAGDVFRDPRGIALDSGGNVLVADSGNQRVRVVSSTGTVSSIAGNGTSGACGSGLAATSAQLASPFGVAAVGTSLYVADYRGNRIVRLDPTSGRLPLTPYFEAGWISNSASYQPVPVAPGEIITIFGTGLGPNNLSGAQLAADPGYIDTQTGGTRVYFDGKAAPMIYSFEGQISAVAPYSLAGSPCTEVQVEYNGVRSASVSIPVRATVPGIYALNAQGFGPAVVVNQDGSFNSAANPAPRGSVIAFFGTGEGLTNPAGVDGKRALDYGALPKPVVTPTIYFGTPFYGTGAVASARPEYAGAAPTFTAGLMQFNVKIPDTAPTGAAVPLYAYFLNSRSKTEITVAIR